MKTFKKTASLFLPLCLFFFAMPFHSLAQQPGTNPTTTTTEQQLESVTEKNEDNETQDDSYVQQLQQFLKDPVNLNTADANTLKDLLILTPLQIQNLLSYRDLFGKFISIYELQAVPKWDLSTIDKLRPFITVSNQPNLFNSFGERLSGGDHSIVARVTQTLERSKGYLVDTSTTTNYYPGSPQRLLIRYKYQYKNLLQYGIVAEKDAGEEFFKGSQKQGFDFYSVHLFARNIGIIKSLALGDFTVNMGQGLTQWQSLAFTKSADVLNIKRQQSVLKPYNSAGEIYFHRGIGITIAKNNFEATVFASYRKLDANLAIRIDTLNNEDLLATISSLQTSGLHRTKSEVEDKGAQRQIAYGGNVAFNKGNFHIGVNAIQYQFKLAIQKSDAGTYNLFALTGRNIGNQSVDYSYTFKNVHVFGEAAFDNKANKAFVNGLLISVDERVDMSLLYRNISQQYQSLYTNAFTENTLPNNEKGLYAGISIRPDNYWRVDAYADFYRFPWLKYLVDAPSTGFEYFTQLTYKPNKQLEMYARFRSESKAKNFNPEDLITDPVVQRPRQNFRWQLSYKISSPISFRSRIELTWFDKNGPGKQNGFLSYADLIYKPSMKKYSGNLRLQYFETDGYDSRMYAYENDVLYSFSIPVFYGKGYRYYVNVNYDFSKRLSVWFRWAQYVYRNQDVVGSSGLDQIQGNKKTEVKLQLQYFF